MVIYKYGFGGKERTSIYFSLHYAMWNAYEDRNCTSFTYIQDGDKYYYEDDVEEYWEEHGWW